LEPGRRPPVGFVVPITPEQRLQFNVSKCDTWLFFILYPSRSPPRPPAPRASQIARWY